MFGAMLITTKSSEMTLQFCRGLHICIHATKLQVIRTLQTEVLGDGQRNEHEQKTRAHRRQLGHSFKTKNTGPSSPKEKTMYT